MTGAGYDFKPLITIFMFLLRGSPVSTPGCCPYPIMFKLQEELLVQYLVKSLGEIEEY